jgi:hypothetical protein
VSNCHFDALLELTNGDMDDGYITSEELGALQVAGYCNVVTRYICDRDGNLSAYKEGAPEEEACPYILHFPEVDEMKDIGSAPYCCISSTPTLLYNWCIETSFFSCSIFVKYTSPQPPLQELDHTTCKYRHTVVSHESKWGTFILEKSIVRFLSATSSFVSCTLLSRSNILLVIQSRKNWKVDNLMGITFFVAIITSDKIVVLETSTFTHSLFLIEQIRPLNTQHQHTQSCVLLVFLQRCYTQLFKSNSLATKTIIFRIVGRRHHPPLALTLMGASILILTTLLSDCTLLSR